MSWDIYGNPLRRGHCEVHPHVHEEYPCSVCMAERSIRNHQQQPSYEIERLNYELDQQNDYIKELTLSNQNLNLALQKVSDYNLRLEESQKSFISALAKSEEYITKLETDRDNYIKLKFYVEKILLEGDWYISAIEGNPHIDFEEVRKDIADVIGWEE